MSLQISNTTIATTSMGVAQPADALTVTVPAQPAVTLAPAGALYVPFTKITLTAGSSDVTVQNMTIERTGPAEDAAFYDVDLLDDDGSTISTAYLTSNHKATFQDSFTVTAGTSKTLSVVGDMQSDLSNYDGEMAGFQIDSIAASTNLSGALPVRGTAQKINNSLIIGSALASLSGDDPNGATTHYVNDRGIRFSGIRITAGSQEDVSLSSVSWEQVGTASASDLANIAIRVDGTSYPTDTSDGRYYTATFPTAILIKKGNAVDVSISGDVLPTAANRTVEFDINSATDVALTGTTYGYGIYLTPSEDTAESGNSVFLTTDGDTDGVSLTPFFAGSVATILPGTLNSIGN